MIAGNNVHNKDKLHNSWLTYFIIKLTGSVESLQSEVYCRIETKHKTCDLYPVSILATKLIMLTFNEFPQCFQENTGINLK
jgi:hypothetical protein